MQKLEASKGQDIAAKAKAMERHSAILLMEGRTGLVLLRDWRCMLRVCMDAAPEEEPY